MPKVHPDTEKNNNADSNDEPLTKFHVIATFFSSLGGTAIGFNLTIISFAMLKARTSLASALEWHDTISTAILCSAALFSMVSAPVNEILGRRLTIIVSTLFLIFGSILSCLANGVAMIIPGRVLMGLSLGISSTTIPLYVSECSPTKYRGRLLGLYQLFTVCGMLFGATMPLSFTNYGSKVWRLYFAFPIFIATIHLIGMLLGPETPFWLATKGKSEAAKRAYSWLNNKDCDLPPNLSAILKESKGKQPEAENKDSDADVTFSSKLKANAKEMGSHANVIALFRLFTERACIRTLLLGLLVHLMQQLAGVNAIIYTLEAVIKASGAETATKVIWLAVILIIIFFIGSVKMCIFIDKLGRRFILLVSSIGVIVSMILLAIAFFLMASSSPEVSIHQTLPPGHTDRSNCLKKDSCLSCTANFGCGFCFILPHPKAIDTSLLTRGGSCLPSASVLGKFSSFGPCSDDSKSHYQFAYDLCPMPKSCTIFTLIALSLLFGFFAFGLASLPWTLCAEIFPIWGRSTGMAFITACGWFINFLVTVTFVSIGNPIGRGALFIVYAIFMILLTLLSYIIVPETKEKTFEEIEPIMATQWNFRKFQF